MRRLLWLLLLAAPALAQNNSVILLNQASRWLPTVPGNAYRWGPLEVQGGSCPSSIDPTSKTQQGNCFFADSVDATAAAGAGINSPTQITFGNHAPTLAGPLGAMMVAVSNAPAVVVSATGTSGASTVTVASISGLAISATVTGTGIGSGAAIAGTWDKASTTIPLTVANSGTVNGNLTFSTTFTSNSVFPRHLLCSSAPTTPADVTTGTITVHAGTLTVGTNSMTLTGMTGSESGGAQITTIQVIVDGTKVFDSAQSQSAPYSPATVTLPLTTGNHTFAVKAWVGANSSVTANGTVSLGGGPCDTLSHLLEHVDIHIDASATTTSNLEHDPDHTVLGQEAYASIQCGMASSSHPGTIRFWDSLGRAWVDPPGGPYSCTTWTPGSNHSIDFLNTFDVPNHKYAYQTLVVDGVLKFHNLNAVYSDYTLPNGNLYTGVGAQFQIDGTSSTPRTGLGNAIYAYNWVLTAW